MPTDSKQPIPVGSRLRCGPDDHEQVTAMKPDSKINCLDNSVLHLLHRAGQQAEIVFMGEISEDDLTPRQYAVLLCVDANEDISQTGLVDATGIDRSTLADVVRRLVTKGHLSRKRTRRDARMYAVRITARGREALNAARPGASRADERVLNVLPVRERQIFVDTLAEVVRKMDSLMAKAN
jgi:DNA-binding MarR family transcriptional regulator